MSRAVGLAEQLLGTYKARISLLEIAPFSDGRFEVFLDEVSLFSKHKMGRFPDWTEIKGAVDSTSH